VGGRPAGGDARSLSVREAVLERVFMVAGNLAARLGKRWRADAHGRRSARGCATICGTAGRISRGSMRRSAAGAVGESKSHCGRQAPGADVTRVMRPSCSASCAAPVRFDWARKCRRECSRGDVDTANRLAVKPQQRFYRRADRAGGRRSGCRCTRRCADRANLDGPRSARIVVGADGVRARRQTLVGRITKPEYGDTRGAARCPPRCCAGHSESTGPTSGAASGPGAIVTGTPRSGDAVGRGNVGVSW